MTNPEAVAPRFRVGDQVEVLYAFPLGHVRTPFYVRGKTGFVERLCGIYGNPEDLAYGRSGNPRQPLYRVRFTQCDIWPDYEGGRADSVDVEIYQHWLELKR